MSRTTPPPAVRHRAVRTLLLAVSVLVLLAVVRVGVGTAAALAVAGVVGVGAGFVALMGGRGAAAVSRRGRRGAVAVLALGGAGAFLGGTAFAAPASPPPAAVHAARAAAPTAPSSSTAPAAATALETLETLPVRAAATAHGYRASRFGKRWTDVDGNGCPTDDDVLRRDLAHAVQRGCRPVAGALTDPATGRTVQLEAGGRPRIVVDRVVSLREAWRTGAAALPTARRVALANDPLGLQAVPATQAARHRGRDVAHWLPEHGGCAWVARQTALKAAYGLWVTPAERTAMTGVLRTCPATPLPGPALTTTVEAKGTPCSVLGARAVSAAGTALACRRTQAHPEPHWTLPA